MEKGKAARDGADRKMSTTWTNIFSNKWEDLKKRWEKKENRYDPFLNVQRERIAFDQKRVRMSR